MDFLACVDSWDLDDFHLNNVQPNKEFLQKAGRAINSICDFLKMYCFQDGPWSDVKVPKVVKGGSLGKGTSMKNGSDADLVLFLNIFNSFTDQEKERKGIIDEIKRRLKEWQKEPYTLDVEVGFLLDLLKSYRDLEKDPKEITQKIKMWLQECKKELYLSDDDLVPFQNLFERYLKLENDRRMIIEEIECWRNKGWPEPYLSNADLRYLLNLYKRYREMEKEETMMIEKIRWWPNKGRKKPHFSTADLQFLLDILERYTDKEEDQMMIIKKIARWRNNGRGKPYLSDADLGFLLDLLKRYTEKEEQQKMIFKEMKRWFNQCKEDLRLELIFEKSKWPNPRVLQFKLRSKKSMDFIEFDVLPAYDALGQYQCFRPDPQIYVSLIGTGKCGEFSPCFTELQRDFIVDRTTKLKNLIRLVKYWYNELQEKPLPPKYALELLTVYAWEEGSGQDKFDMAEGFRTVLWLIEHYKKIRIYWTEYYDFDNAVIKRYLQAQLRKNRPVILDPADPTANFGEAKGWDQLARKAKSYAAMNCCQKLDGSFIQPWNVPTDSACCQKFDPDQLKFESAFRPSKLAKKVPQEESWCTLL